MPDEVPNTTDKPSLKRSGTGALKGLGNVLSGPLPLGRILLLGALLFALLAVGLFSWNRWLRYDDAADLLGSWKAVGGEGTLIVGESYLKLADDAIYEYELDTFRKVITYHFGDDSGFSSYRFSEDRQMLVLEDNAETSLAVVLHFADDPGFASESLPEGIVRLEKVSSDVPKISPPGSEREKSPLSHGPSSLVGASSSSASTLPSAGSSSKEGSSAADSDSWQDEADTEDLVMGPDGATRGYYDEDGTYVPVEWGYYDENGNIVFGAEGYSYDAYGNIIGSATGTWGEEDDYSAEDGLSGQDATDGGW